MNDRTCDADQECIIAWDLVGGYGRKEHMQYGLPVSRALARRRQHEHMAGLESYPTREVRCTDESQVPLAVMAAKSLEREYM